MKRILFALVLMLGYVASSMAQTASEHLTFKGIPIDGPLNTFVAKMKAAGFKHIGTEDGIAYLEGDFAGSKGCIVGVATLQNSNTVNTVGVIFPKHDDWSTLEREYNSLKEMLTRKYGKPSDCREEFQWYTTPKDNSTKLHCLQMDRCTYETDFETTNGDIRLALAHTDRLDCFVLLKYWDKINTDTVKTQIIDDL